MEFGIQYIRDIKGGARMVFFWRLLYYLQSFKEIVMDIVFVDGSIVPLHRHGGGALKKEGYPINRYR